MICLIKDLEEENFVNEAVSASYRMKQFHCKPDVCAYNVVIYALCRVGFFKKDRFILNRMEITGFRYPPDVFTYIIMISCYCRYGMETSFRKAIRGVFGRRIICFGESRERTPPGIARLPTPSTQAETPQLIEPADQPDLDALEYAVNKSESAGAEDAVIDYVTEQKDVVPLDKFLPLPSMAKCSDEL
ncbi:hypothetical protein ACS0TY_014621 [Phlomoides rotata]